MTVYVDSMRAKFGRMVMCHMLADSDAELHEMADKIGVARKWHQAPPKHDSHYDIALSKRALAVKHGAVEITWRQASAMSMVRRIVGHLPDPERSQAMMKAVFDRGPGIHEAVVCAPTLRVADSLCRIDFGWKPVGANSWLAHDGYVVRHVHYRAQLEGLRFAKALCCNPQNDPEITRLYTEAMQRAQMWGAAAMPPGTSPAQPPDA